MTGQVGSTVPEYWMAAEFSQIGSMELDLSIR